MKTKDTNPKAALGAAKPGLSVVPCTALYAMAAAHMDGAYKYGAHNWRKDGVSARTYYDAAMRHLTAWWEGEDIAPDSGVDHLGHVMACMAILIDAKVNGKLNDDRPLRPPAGWMAEHREAHKFITNGRTAVEPFTEKEHGGS